MPRGSPLGLVRRLLKGHLGEDVAEGAGTANDILYNQLLSSKQVVIATRYQWPFLMDRWDITVPIATRFATLPTQTIDGISGAINTDNEVVMKTRYDAVWIETVVGITEEDYNILDPDLNQLMDPVQKWRYNGPNGFEIWPLPASKTTLRFVGYRIPDPVVSDEDVFDLDDELIALFVAAERLAKSESQDAQLKMREAEYRLSELRAATSDGRGVLMGYKRNKGERRKNVPIAIAGGIRLQDFSMYPFIGSYVIPPAVDSGVVIGLALKFNPTKVVGLSVSKPPGGLDLFANFTGNLSVDGFSFELSGVTDSGNYVLSFVVA